MSELHIRSDGPRAVLARLIEAVRQYDMDAQANLHAEDGVLEWPFAPPGMPRRVEGREAIRRVLAPLGERVKLTGRSRVEYGPMVIHDTSDPDVIVVEFDLTGEGKTGESYQLSYIQVLQVRNGEIVSFRDYWDPQAISALLAEG